MTHNFRDPVFVANPYPTYDEWRARAPVLKRDAGDWLVTGFDEIAAAFTNPRLGHHEARSEGADDGSTGGVARLLMRGARAIARWPLTNDPPAHGRLRQPFMDLAAGAQGPSTLDWVEKMTARARAKASADGGFDVVSDLALPLTLGHSCEQLGVPEADWPAIGILVRRMEDAIDVDAPAPLVANGLLATAALDDYVGRLLRARPSPPPAARTLIRLMDAVCQRELDEDEASAAGAVSLLASSSTTESLISSAMKNLLSHSNAWTAVTRNPMLLDGAVEESLRFDTPAQVVSRTALADASLGGETILAGETVRLLLGAGNRDPRRCEQPDRFDVTRPRRKTLSMGLGIHTCPGAGQARFVARRVLQQIGEWAPNARLTDEPLVWRPGFQVRGLESLRVEL